MKTFKLRDGTEVSLDGGVLKTDGGVEVDVPEETEATSDEGVSRRTTSEERYMIRNRPRTLTGKLKR